MQAKIITLALLFALSVATEWHYELLAIQMQEPDETEEPEKVILPQIGIPPWFGSYHPYYPARPHAPINYRAPLVAP